jgi:hypothetical protein
MWAAILGFLPFLQDIINWWSGVEQAQAGANSAESAAEAAHQNDGAQSVADAVSGASQNASLDAIANQLDNPPPATIVVPK